MALLWRVSKMVLRSPDRSRLAGLMAAGGGDKGRAPEIALRSTGVQAVAGRGRKWLLLALTGTIALAAPHVASAAPANDLFANAQLLTGISGSVAGSNVGATSEPGEPNAGYGMGMGFTVWYRWTAPASGRF